MMKILSTGKALTAVLEDAQGFQNACGRFNAVPILMVWSILTGAACHEAHLPIFSR